MQDDTTTLSNKKAVQTVKKNGNGKTARNTSRRAAPKSQLTISLPDLLAGGSDREFRRLVHNLFAFGSRIETLRAGFAERIGLTGIEYTFLIAIRHLGDEGDVSVRQVADHLHVSSPFSTTTVGKLIKRSLVAKEDDPDDKRKVRLRVTDKGHALLAQLAPIQRQVNDIQFGCLSAKEFRTLLDLFDRLIDSGDKALALQAYLTAGGAS